MNLQGNRRLFPAVLTPLHNDDLLHVQGLEAHLEDQWQAGIDGILVAGSMGEMQLLTDETYRQLVEHAIRVSGGRGEIMVGVGDTSLRRTLQRIEFVNRHSVDGVVVLTPYLFTFTPEELVDYYLALGDASRHPVYLYDVPVLTHCKLDLETVERVAEHPNIHGIKVNRDLDWTGELLRRMADRFRVIVARPKILGLCCGRASANTSMGCLRWRRLGRWRWSVRRNPAIGIWPQDIRSDSPN